MTKSQELLKEIEELWVNHLKKIKEYTEEEKKEGSRKRLEQIWGEEEEKFCKAMKDKMLSDLSSWALEPQSYFYRADGKVIKPVELNYECGTLIFLGENYSKEIRNGFIQEIKQSPQDWKIRKAEPIINGIPFDYGTHWAVEHKLGRKHYSPTFDQRQIRSFTREEWTEIENVIIKQEELTKQYNYLKELIKELEVEIDRLKREIKEIQELKKKDNNSPKYHPHLAEKETELQSKQQKLEQLRGVVKVGNSEQKPKSYKTSDFPTGLVFGCGVLISVLVVAIWLVVKKRKNK